VRAFTDAEIPVVGHIGLTPQSVHRMGGYRVQDRSETAAAQLCEDVLALQHAGAVALVLEGIPRELAARITGLLTIPTILDRSRDGPPASRRIRSAPPVSRGVTQVRKR
jgi:3-methyl-2-oxobutanoate hydroxymethyltransferase